MDLKKIAYKVAKAIASKVTFAVTSTRMLPQDPENPGFADFEVSGTFKGKPYVYKISAEIDGRDLDFELLQGDEDFLAEDDSMAFDALGQIFQTIEPELDKLRA